VLGDPADGPLWLLAAPVTVALAWWGGPLLGAGYALLTALAILVTFTTVNLVMVSLIPRFEHHASRFVDLWPALLIAFGATIAELALADVVRLALLRLVARL
jgi:hypothetical protein